MEIQILNPKATIFKGEVESVSVPGIDGEFQILKHHAPIVSILKKGKIKLHSVIKSETSLDNLESSGDNEKTYKIEGGVIEFSKNKGIILCD